MSYYQPNPACRCRRCSTRGLMAPIVLVTLGLLFLLANNGQYPFHRTWPILLIVIGAVKVLRYGSAADHVNPGYPPPTSYGPGYPTAGPNQMGRGPVVTPPPAPVAGTLGQGDNEVHHG